MRRILPLLLVPLLVLAACGSDDGGETSDRATGDPATLDSITVEGADGETPTMSFDTPFSVNETTAKVLTAGSGDVTFTAGGTWNGAKGEKVAN